MKLIGEQLSGAVFNSNLKTLSKASESLSKVFNQNNKLTQKTFYFHAFYINLNKYYVISIEICSRTGSHGTPRYQSWQHFAWWKLQCRADRLWISRICIDDQERLQLSESNCGTEPYYCLQVTSWLKFFWILFSLRDSQAHDIQSISCWRMDHGSCVICHVE